MSRIARWLRRRRQNHMIKFMAKIRTGMTDYSIEVLWDGEKKGVWMHESQVEFAKKKP